MDENTIYTDRHFDGERVLLSTNTFNDCIFTKCRLVFDGRPFQANEIDATGCDWELAGAASETIGFFKVMWQDLAMPITVSKFIGHITGIAPQEVHRLLTSAEGSGDHS